MKLKSKSREGESYGEVFIAFVDEGDVGMPASFSVLAGLGMGMGMGGGGFGGRRKRDSLLGAF